MATPIHQFEGKYEILEKIAEGGMGAVYKVRHRLLDVIRVIKVMRPQLEQQEGIRARFLREARLAIKMRHPNIAQLDDFSMDEDGNAFIVMEYIDGITLQEFLERLGTPPLALGLEIARQSLDALAYLHRKHVIHRDISPDNLMVARDEAGEMMVKLIDLGIAKTLQQGESNLTATGMFVGKIRYASPEHFKTGEGLEVDQGSDIYSFGLVLYETLTGHHPIAGESFSTLIAGHLFRPPMEFATSDPAGSVPEELRRIVLKAIEKAPEDRFQNCETFRDEVAALQGRHPLDQAEFERLFMMRDQELPTLRIQRKPGSTQNRIDDEFKNSAAPAMSVDMTSSATAVDAGAANRVSREISETRVEAEKTKAGGDQKATALVSAARHLVELELFKEARVQLESVRGFDPDNADANALLREVESGEARQEALAVAVQEAGDLLASGKVEQAQERVNEAISQLGEGEALTELLERIEAGFSERRTEKVKAGFAEVDRLLVSGDVDGAATELAEVRNLDAEADGLARRASEVAIARQRRDEEARREVRIADLRGQAKRDLDGGESAAAISKLQEALELSPDDDAVKAQLGAAQKTVKLAEEHQRLASVLAAAVTNIDGLIRREDFSSARSAVEKARQELGADDEELAAAAGRIDQAEAGWRAGRVEAVQRSAQARLADGAFEQAIEELGKGLELAPDHQGLKAQLQDSEKALERHRLQQAASKVAEEVELLLGKDQVDRAAKVLSKAQRELGGPEPLVAVAELIEQARQGKRDEEQTQKLERAEAAAAKTAAKEKAAAEKAAADKAAKEKAAEEKASRDSAAKEQAAKDKVARDEAAKEKAAKAQAAKEKAAAEKAAKAQAAKDKAAKDKAAKAQAAKDKAAKNKAAKEQAAKDKAAKAAARVAPEKKVASAKAVDKTLSAPVAVTAARKMPEKKSVPVWVWAAAAGAVVVIGIIGVFQMGGGEDPTPGPAGATSGLVIVATPWAEVVDVQAADGTSQILPTGAVTPLRLDLEPGTYTVTLRHDGRSEPVVREVELGSSGETRVVAEMVPSDIDDFLRRHGVEP